VRWRSDASRIRRREEEWGRKCTIVELSGVACWRASEIDNARQHHRPTSMSGGHMGGEIGAREKRTVVAVEYDEGRGILYLQAPSGGSIVEEAEPSQ
jgi:hypothetical protein